MAPEAKKARGPPTRKVDFEIVMPPPGTARGRALESPLAGRSQQSKTGEAGNPSSALPYLPRVNPNVFQLAVKSTAVVSREILEV